MPGCKWLLIITVFCISLSSVLCQEDKNCSDGELCENCGSIPKLSESPNSVNKDDDEKAMELDKNCKSNYCKPIMKSAKTIFICGKEQPKCEDGKPCVRNTCKDLTVNRTSFDKLAKELLEEEAGKVGKYCKSGKCSVIDLQLLCVPASVAGLGLISLLVVLMSEVFLLTISFI